MDNEEILNTNNVNENGNGIITNSEEQEKSESAGHFQFAKIGEYIPSPAVIARLKQLEEIRSRDANRKFPDDVFFKEHTTFTDKRQVWIYLT